jgi:hypothetical protein
MLKSGMIKEIIIKLKEQNSLEQNEIIISGIWSLLDTGSKLMDSVAEILKE